jgi:dihydroorotate dehydrogenase (NAD+) catalytic subunit
MRKTAPAGADIGIELAGIELRNPFMLASGILGETGDLLLAAHRAGAGAVVTKSIGMEPRDGHKNPCVYQCESGMLNAMGLPNPGIDEFSKEMRVLKGSRAVVIGSIFGAKPQDFASLAKKMRDYGAAAIELNLSCPHAKGYGAEIGSNPATVKGITASVVRAVDIPVFAKLTPNTRDICSLGLAAEEAGAAAVVAINTLRAMAIDPYIRKPVLANRYGGLSGPGIKPVGVRCVFELSEALSIPIIGVGGISTALDAAEYIMAGASAVQVGTVVQQKGIEVFSKLPDELKEFMTREGFRSISQMRGVAHEG